MMLICIVLPYGKSMCVCVGVGGGVFCVGWGLFETKKLLEVYVCGGRVVSLASTSSTSGNQDLNL